MATGTNIKTYFQGTWHDGDVPIMRAGDHGSWLGSSVFDGARFVDGLAPDLDAHCARVNRSAEALMVQPTARYRRNTDGIHMLRSAQTAGAFGANVRECTERTSSRIRLTPLDLPLPPP